MIRIHEIMIWYVISPVNDKPMRCPQLFVHVCVFGFAVIRRRGTTFINHHVNYDIKANHASAVTMPAAHADSQANPIYGNYYGQVSENSSFRVF
jgi:hypothetical protein